MSGTLAAKRPVLSPTQTGWDSQVFVLRGDDRQHLRARIRILTQFLDGNSEASPLDLSATLAHQLQPDGIGLGVVASTIADLRIKLQRAVDRLGNPNCKLIRDATGTYFTEQPLFHQGTLALLFPGEGAQYPNMLADLCGLFPEVEETFAWCDRLAAESGHPEDSLRNILHPPHDSSPEERNTAEAQLRRLGPSIFGVLVADLAISKVLKNLELPVSAVAGHSAGELAALLASGVVPSDAFIGPRLTEIMEMMQRQEDEAGGPDICLLAIGAGKATIVEIATAFGGSEVFIAMDNCPHQCVLVGSSDRVAKIESVLLEKGLVCERLPFRRPYHTPLFEPWMGPYRALFDHIPFELPRTPVYCCSTGKMFPTDAKAIRQLAVNHWVSPVEFTNMIETMYDDGVRLFVEAGPRGNLAAFTEDILRGRPFAAIPANIQRKSGPTQLNHLIAQLVVNQVPLNVNHLFNGMDAEVVNWDMRSSGAQNLPHPSESQQHDFTSVRHEAYHSHIETMNGYLTVMEQFLDVQESIMRAYLNGTDHSNGSYQTDGVAVPEFETTHSIDRLQPAFALIGEIMQFEPGHSITARRLLDEREDLFADHHTLAGRGVSRVDPGQNGLPVLPMTFSIEGMAEAASLLAPGKFVVAVRNIRLFRWIPFDLVPTTLEIRATITSIDEANGIVEVKADVRDLGNSFVKDGEKKIAAEAVLVLADHYPVAPQPRPFHLTDEQPCRITVDELRRNMFHGPLFQMITQLDRQGNEGIDGRMEVQPRTGWFRSNSHPQILLDPVLIDASMHIFGAWHLEQPDWTGRILLPYEVQCLEFFGPTPGVGSQLSIRGHNEQESARHFQHGLELFTEDGQLWLRMSGAGYWRFYLPFGHVNFFGPKDEYYLSREWPEADSPQSSPWGRCFYLDPPVDLKQPVLRAAGARVTMTPRELREFQEWRGSDDELNNWFFGRMVAKDAVRACWMEKYGVATFPADLETDVIDDRLVCSPRGESGIEPLPPVTVAIANGRVIAFSAFATQVGLALLPVSATDHEKDVRQVAAALAIADALKISSSDLKHLPTERERGEFHVSLPETLIESHPSLAGRAVKVQTARREGFLVATTTCERVPQ